MMNMKITKGTLVRTVLVALVLLNRVLQAFGLDLIPVNENSIYLLIETGIEIAVLVVGFWKNNSFSNAAIEADAFLHELKDSEK